jgi:hypothetical protein
VVGYRSFPYGFGGHPHFLNDGSFMFGHFGFGFPVAVGVSGPVTTYYDDPLGRQRRMVEEGMRKLAEGAGASNR